MRTQHVVQQLLLVAAASVGCTAATRPLTIHQTGLQQDLRPPGFQDQPHSSSQAALSLTHSNIHSQQQTSKQQVSGSFGGNASQEAGPASLRLVACTLLKDEVPYLVEWIEFHRLVGFSHIVIYDDGSQDNANLIPMLYKQHGRDYVSYETIAEWDENPRTRRINAGGECLKKYKHLADWIIHLDVDEFIFSAKYNNLQDYFRYAVPNDVHILHAGATRFGWGGMRHRHAYTLSEVHHLSQALRGKLAKLSLLWCDQFHCMLRISHVCSTTDP